MSSPTPRQVHIDGPLTNLTVAHIQSQEVFIADKVFPVVNVDKQSDLYYVYDPRDFTDVQVAERAPDTEANAIGMRLTTDNYFARVYALATNLGHQMLSNEDTALDIRTASAVMVAQQMLLHRERTWVNTFFAESVWANEVEGFESGASGFDPAANIAFWDDYANSTPILDVTNMRRSIQLASAGAAIPNVMVVGKETRDALVNHPDILARINGGATTVNPAMVTDMFLASIFEVERFLTLNAVQNTAAHGAAFAPGFLGGKSAALYYTPPAAGLMVPAAGYTFAWNGTGEVQGAGVSVQSYTGDWLDVKGIAERLEVNMAYDQKVVGTTLGGFFKDAVAG